MNPFDILGLPHDGELDVATIEKAFKKMSLKMHPDKANAATVPTGRAETKSQKEARELRNHERFVELTQARDRLIAFVTRKDEDFSPENSTPQSYPSQSSRTSYSSYENAPRGSRSSRNHYPSYEDASRGSSSSRNHYSSYDDPRGSSSSRNHYSSYATPRGSSSSRDHYPSYENTSRGSGSSRNHYPGPASSGYSQDNMDSIAHNLTGGRYAPLNDIENELFYLRTELFTMSARLERIGGRPGRPDVEFGDLLSSFNAAVEWTMDLEGLIRDTKSRLIDHVTGTPVHGRYFDEVDRVIAQARTPLRRERAFIDELKRAWTPSSSRGYGPSLYERLNAVFDRYYEQLGKI